MKIAINSCYGGFRLSTKATQRIHELKCPHQRLMTFMEYTGGTGYVGNNMNYKFKSEDEARANTIKHQISSFPYIVINNKILVDDHDEDENRSCPILIQVIEELGEEASNKVANIKIVDIPDNTDYEIEECDGWESVAEKRRSWG